MVLFRAVFSNGTHAARYSNGAYISRQSCTYFLDTPSTFSGDSYNTISCDWPSGQKLLLST